VLQSGRTIQFPNESTVVVATPETTGDRYRVIGTTPPEGGPGIKGTGPDLHPGLIEVFRCVSGTMTVRVGKDLFEASPGDVVEVPAGTVHGFVNTDKVPVVAEVDLIFTPPGSRPQADLILFAILDGLIRSGQVSKRTGLPPISQQALLLRCRFSEAMDQPGIAKLAMRPLAALGRLGRYPTEYPEYESRPDS
jgi:mannose-6-phosphate isomerase-like protein (cupin superfamily)